MAYVPEAILFNGTDSELDNADIGISDGKVGLFSVWLRIDSGDGTTRKILNGENNDYRMEFLSNNKFRLLARNTVNTTILQGETSAILASSSYFHLLMSWDLAAGQNLGYVDDSSDWSNLTTTDDTIDYTSGGWDIGHLLSGSNYAGGMADFYFTDEFLDISVEANRRKFIDSSGNPVNLGSDGSTPTGTQPLIYLKEGGADAGDNAGSGGDFTRSGTFGTTSGPVSPPSGFNPAALHRPASRRKRDQWR